MLRRPALARSLLAIFLCAGLATTASAQFSQVFFFGDSLTDSGNVALAIGSDPAQVITGNGYIPSQPYASGQFSNGDVWAKTFASALGLPMSGQPSLAGGGDYAFGGARVATDGAGLPPSLLAQQGMFLQSVGNVAPSTALYVIAGGGNDARDALAVAAGSMNPFADIAAAARAYAQATASLVDQLQAAGAQQIVVWDVPDIGLTPAVMNAGGGASFLGTAVSRAMNRALARQLDGETGVSIFDIFGLQNDIVADPAGFGLLNVTDACGAPSAQCDPATALYWDGIHPTAAAHALIAQNVLVAAVPEPSEVALMLAGLVFVATWRRRARRGAASRAAGADAALAAADKH